MQKYFDPGNVLLVSSVDLFLPKFSINADASLDSTLQELGMNYAYSDSADFSGISTEARLKISKVWHAKQCHTMVEYGHVQQRT